MRVDYLTPVYVETMSSELEEGKIYISKKYNTAIHLCCCGCGGKTVTPLNHEGHAGGWTLTENENGISLHPSIGNWGWEAPNYHAHYVITNNVVNWC